MIELTYLNNKPFVLNADLIESIESTPDTLITLTVGRKIMVKESVAEVKHRILEYRRFINREITHD